MFLELLVTLPLIFPPMATGFLLLYILGKNGFLGRYFNALDIHFVFDIKGLVLAGFISGLPLMVKPLQSVFETFPKSLIEAAEICGKSKFQTALFVIFPNCIKTIIATLIIACARAVGEVGISLMLGGNIIGKTDTISLAIYNAVYDGQHEKALFFSIFLISISGILFFIISRLSGKNVKQN